MLVYEYMVTYISEGHTGRICITRNRTIDNYDDVESLDETIRKINVHKNAIALDFKLLREYQD